MIQFRMVVVVFLVVVATASAMCSLSAADPKQAAGDGSADPQIADWISKLDHEDFVTRQEASRHLLESGERAVGPLVAAAHGESPEAAQRAFAILERMFQSEQVKVREAAKVALELLVDGTDDALAARAKLAMGIGVHGGAFAPGMMPPGMMPPGMMPPGAMPLPGMMARMRMPAAIPGGVPGMKPPVLPPPVIGPMPLPPGGVLPALAPPVPIAALPVFAPPPLPGPPVMPPPLFVPPGISTRPLYLDPGSLRRLSEINAELKSITRGLRATTNGLKQWRAAKG